MNDWIPFTKMHGLGNDYVYLDERQFDAVGDNLAPWARSLSDRHRGIGGDGLIILRRDPEHSCRMEMYNADGSRAEMCGNGIRCVAALAWQRGYARSAEFSVATDDGAKAVSILSPAQPHDGSMAGVETTVRVAMGTAVFAGLLEQVDTTTGSFVGSVVTIGNPHFVVLIDDDPRDYPVEVHGPLLERAPLFPDRTNVEFVRIRGRDRIDFRVWERGSGETLACGTGATAAVAALHRRGLVDDRVTVTLLGGDLVIEIEAEARCFMTGPATVSFCGHCPAPSVQP